MNPGKEVTVGAVLLGALVLLAAGAYFLLGWGAGAGRYPVHVVFPEAPVQKGDMVRLAGVKVGEVQEVALTKDHRARVTIALDRQVKIRRKYRIEVTSGVLVGTNQIDITPVRPGGRIVKPGETLYGTRPPQLADLMEETREVIAQLGEAAQSATDILGNKDLFEALEAALAQVAAVGQQVGAVGQTARAGIERILPSIERAAADVAEAAKHARAVAKAAEEALADPALRRNISEAAANIADASERLDSSIAALQQIVEAPEFRQNVQAAVAKSGETLDSIKRAAESIEKTSDAVREVAERAGKVAEKVSRIGVIVPEASGSLSIEWHPQQDHTWVEANANLNLGDRLLRIGLTDVGDDARVNLQLGRPAGRGMLRMGLVQSELGLGYDVALGRSATLSADVFDANDLRMNLLGYRSIAPGYEAVLGLRDIGRDSRVSVGVRATR